MKTYTFITEYITIDSMLVCATFNIVANGIKAARMELRSILKNLTYTLIKANSISL